MSIRQSLPIESTTIAAGAVSIDYYQQGSRIIVSSLTGGDVIQVSIDGGAYQDIAPGFPVNCGDEIFSRVTFKNPGDADITFKGEIGFIERADTRTHIPNGEGLPVSVTGFSTIAPQAVATIADSDHADFDANTDRKVLSIYNDGDGVVWVRDQSGTTSIGIPVGGKQQTSIDNFSGAFRIVNNSGASCDVYVTELSA